MSWWPALLLGLTGSFHCAGMCSPLALAATAHQPVTINRVLYNVGRVLTYGILGAIAATAGSLLQFNLLQNWISVTIGALLILMGLGTITRVHIPLLSPLLLQLTGWIKKNFSRYLIRKTRLSVFLMGMLNGLLPCGLTWVALTYCLTFFSQIDGFVFMLIFGAGTLPVMLGFTYVLNWITHKFHFSSTRLATFSFILVGCLLIGRTLLTHAHPVAQASNTEAVCK